MKDIWRKLCDVLFGWLKKKSPKLPDVMTVKPAADDNEIRPDPTIVYTSGDKVNDKTSNEIWGIWHKMNIRVHCNPNELRGFGVPIAGGNNWYAISRDSMPSDLLKLVKTPTGCTAGARDFQSPAGQKYRLEGVFSDGKGRTLHKVRTLTMTDAEMHGALIAYYASVK